VILVPSVLQTLLVSFNTASRLLGPAVAAAVAELTWPWVRRHRSLAVVTTWVAGLTLLTNYGILLGTGIAQEISWSIHLWTGLPFLAALIVGVLTVVVQAPGAGFVTE
jgi:hypothetical protein